MKIIEYLDKKLDKCLDDFDGWVVKSEDNRITKSIEKKYGLYRIVIFSNKTTEFDKSELVKTYKKSWFRTKKYDYYVHITYSDREGWYNHTYKQFNLDDSRVDKIFEFLNEEMDKKKFMKYLPKEDQMSFGREQKLKRVLDE